MWKFSDVSCIQNQFRAHSDLHRASTGYSVILDRIARYAQGWVPGLSTEQFRDVQPKLRDTLEKYDRKLSDIELVRETSVSLAENREAAFRNIERHQPVP